MKIIYDRVVGGYAAFDGSLKVAVVTTSHHLGLFRNGQAIYEAMPRESWTVHWTSPSLPVALIEVVIASLPAEAAV